MKLSCDLRDREQIPLQEPGGIPGFLSREVLPYAGDLPSPVCRHSPGRRQAGAWYVPKSVKIGYEIRFNRYLYKPDPMRRFEENRADILAVKKETERFFAEILGEGN